MSDSETDFIDDTPQMTQEQKMNLLMSLSQEDLDSLRSKRQQKATPAVENKIEEQVEAPKEEPPKKKRKMSEKQLANLRKAREKRMANLKKAREARGKKKAVKIVEPEEEPEEEPVEEPVEEPEPEPEPKPKRTRTKKTDHQKEIDRLKKELEESRKSNMSGKPAKKARSKKVATPQRAYPEKPKVKSRRVIEVEDSDDDEPEEEVVYVRKRKVKKMEMPSKASGQANLPARPMIDNRGNDWVARLGSYGFNM